MNAFILGLVSSAGEPYHLGLPSSGQPRVCNE